MVDSFIKILDPNFLSAETMSAPEMVLTIKDIDFADCYDDQQKKTVSKQTLFFEETLPMVLNKTNAKMLKRLFSPGEDNPSLCVGHKIVVTTEKVKAFGKVWDALRLKEYSEVKCEQCGKEILPVSGKTVAQLVEISVRNTKKTLCVECMRKFKEQKEKENG